MFYRKSIVLNATNNSSQKAVLSLEANDDMVNGKLRLYNFGVEPKGIISLGINCNGKVIKAGLTRTSSMVYTFLCQMDELPDRFSCAVVNVSNGEAIPILFGSSFNSDQQEQIFDEVLSSLSEAKTMTQVEKVLDDYQIDFADEEKKQIDEQIEKCMAEGKTDSDICQNCKYREYFYQNIDSLSTNTSLKHENREKSEEIETKKSFYLDIKAQVDDIFDSNPSETYLESLLPNSKWVKVDLQNGDYYVLGLIYDGEEIKYICYGVPGVYQKNPPRELSGYPIWFPLDQQQEEGFGYWLSYQDAQSGESVKAVIV